jgi:hypothetical protein
MQTERQLKAIYINNAKKLESHALEWARESGVDYQPIALYTLSQNVTTK